MSESIKIGQADCYWLDTHRLGATTLNTTSVFLRSTIGKLEPSYVIRKFLDAQRIHNLTAYLQALHRQSLANADHTTLLLNCYTKLKDSSKLEEFIKVTECSKKVQTVLFFIRES